MKESGITEQEIGVVVKACQTYKPGDDYSSYGSGVFDTKSTFTAVVRAKEHPELIEEFA